MLNTADEQQILVRCVDVIKRFRKFAFDFRLLRCNVQNVMELHACDVCYVVPV